MYTEASAKLIRRCNASVTKLNDLHFFLVSNMYLNIPVSFSVYVDP